MKKEHAIYNNEFLNNILTEEYQTMANNFQDQFLGEDNMDLLIRDIEALGYNSNDYNLELVEAIQDQLGVNLEEALTIEEHYLVGYFDTVGDFIYELVNETMIIPDHLKYYIDYKAIERDYMHDYTAIDTDQGVAIISNY